MPDPASRSSYLGDGVYAQYMPDKDQVCLFMERPERADDERHGMRIERVCVTPQVFEALLNFAALCWPEKLEEPQV